MKKPRRLKVCQFNTNYPQTQKDPYRVDSSYEFNQITDKEMLQFHNTDWIFYNFFAFFCLAN